MTLVISLQDDLVAMDRRDWTMDKQGVNYRVDIAAASCHVSSAVGMIYGAMTEVNPQRSDKACVIANLIIWKWSSCCASFTWRFLQSGCTHPSGSILHSSSSSGDSATYLVIIAPSSWGHRPPGSELSMLSNAAAAALDCALPCCARSR